MEKEAIKVNDQFKIIFSIVKEISEDNIPRASDYGSRMISLRIYLKLHKRHI